MKRILAVLMAGILLIPALAAAEKGGVELTSRAEVEVVQKNVKGEDVLQRVEASKTNVAPGDTVIYTITFVNNGDQPATGVTVNNPVPEHMLYLDKSAEGKGTSIDFSADNGKTYGALGKLIIRTAAGKEKPASAADITHVRWTMEKPLAPGSKGSVSYRAKVK